MSTQRVKPSNIPDLQDFDADALEDDLNGEIEPDRRAAEPEPINPAVYEDPGPEPEPDDPAARRLAIAELDRARGLFPDVYKQVVGKTNIEELTVSELRAFFEDIKLAVNLRTSSGAFKYIFNGGLDLMEKVVAPRVGQNWTGLTTVFNENPQFSDIVKELELKWGTARYIPPEVKLVFAVVGVTQALNAHHKAGALRQAAAHSTDSIRDNVVPPDL